MAGGVAGEEAADKVLAEAGGLAVGVAFVAGANVLTALTLAVVVELLVSAANGVVAGRDQFILSARGAGRADTKGSEAA